MLCLRIEIMLHNFGTHCDGSMDHHHYTTQSPKKATAFSLLSRRGERRSRRVNYISHFPPVPLSRTLWQSSRALPKPEKGRESPLRHHPFPPTIACDSRAHKTHKKERSHRERIGKRKVGSFGCLFRMNGGDSGEGTPLSSSS